MIKKVTRTVLLGLMSLCASLAYGDWNLNSAGSSVSFVSIKNAMIAESHHFKMVSGSATATGGVTIIIDLGSVETQIQIRNERMIKMLFQTNRFPIATVTTQVPIPTLDAMEVGATESLLLKANLSLHGVNINLDVPVLLVRVSKDSYQVSSQKPVIINASQFGLSPGMEALRAVASLQSITHAVPVTFSLLFEKK